MTARSPIRLCVCPSARTPMRAMGEAAGEGGGGGAAAPIPWSETDLSGITLSNGNLTATKTGGARAGVGLVDTAGANTGVRQVRFDLSGGQGVYLFVGFAHANITRTGDLGGGTNQYAYATANGAKYFNTAYSAGAYANGYFGIVDLVVDFDASQFQFYFNGSGQGVESFTKSGSLYVPAMSSDRNTDAVTVITTADQAGAAAYSGATWWGEA